jgi:hypothetical protein
MTIKTYRTYSLKGLTIPVTTEENVKIQISFKRGCAIGSTATYTTSDPKIQEELESLNAFGTKYYLENAVTVGEEIAKVADEAEVAETPVEEEEKEVVDILDAQTFKNLVELRNALKAKGIDASQITNVKAGETLAKKNGYNYTVEKNA